MQFYRDHLAENLDPNGDIAPPWAKYPEYERFTIGWRPGSSPGWLCFWDVFLETFDPSTDARLAYLRRHPPAPMTWADQVFETLNVGLNYYEQDDAQWIRHELQSRGLIKSDAAYPIWLSQQPEIVWPWSNGLTPTEMVRFGSREFWFISRHIADVRNDGLLSPHNVPAEWEPFVSALTTGELPSLNTNEGLKTMAQMMCAGRVIPPWKLGLNPYDFTSSFGMDCGYTDAFRIWVMSAFDDIDHLARTLAPDEVPEEWVAWTDEHFRFD